MDVHGTMTISAVLDDDDLLGEILVRVAFPTSLVRAALVCKRWLRLSSDPVFLRRFHGLHPPSLLGFYVKTGGTKPPLFVPMPQAPELAAVVRRANFDLGTLGRDSFGFSVDCRNGLLLTSYLRLEPPIRTVRCLISPLYPSRSTTILPPVPNSRITYYEEEIIPNSGGDGFFYLAFGSKGRHTIVYVYVLQDDIWAMYSSVVSEITDISRRFGLPLASLIGDGKIYNLVSVSEIDKLFVLDLASSSLSLVNLPEEVSPRRGRLSLADDCGVHLTHVKDLQIRIWLHRMDNCGVANWFLVNTICLREICGNHMILLHVFEDADDYFFEVLAVGFNSEFVFIETDGNVLYLFDIKRKAAKKVYEVTQEDYLLSVSPFMMVWPSTFPVMKEECDLEE